MLKAIVTGANGFIGRHLISRLLRENVDVTAVTLRPVQFDRRVKILTMDLSRAITVESMSGLSADVIFHLAWASASGEQRANLDEQIKNIAITQNVCNLSVAANCPKIVVTGTVYEELCSQVDKAEKFIPMSYYLFTKRYVYEIFRQFSLRNSKKLIWCTFCHPIGEFNKSNQVITSAIIKMRSGEPLQFGHGENYFDVIDVSDLVKGLYTAGIVPLQKTKYYIGSGTPRKFKNYLLAVRDLVAPDSALHFDPEKKDGLDLKKEWLMTANFFEESGFAAKITFEDSIKRLDTWLIESKGEQT